MKKEINTQEIEALIALLDDSDDVVFNSVQEKIIMLGVSTIPFLQNGFDNSTDELQKERLASLLDVFKLQKLNYEIMNWSKNETHGLLNGLITIAQFGYPNLDVNQIKSTINELAKEIEPKIVGKSNYEIMQEMNKVILDKHSFGANFKNYSGVNNSFINKVIDDKVGNPIMLCMIYLLVAKKLKINLIGINSPKHFLLAITKSKSDEVAFYNDELITQVDYYIDPFNKGNFYGIEKFDKMLNEINFNLNDKVFLPATNLDIIKRVMNNLIYALHTTGEKKSAKDLLKIVDAL